MFGAFTIEMPSFIQSRLSDASNKQRAGTFIGVGVMGALSALIVSACVAPVLIGALTFIAQTGDVGARRASPCCRSASAWARRCCWWALPRARCCRGRRVDGDHQESVRRDVPCGRRVAAGPHRAGLASACCSGRSRCSRWPGCCGARARSPSAASNVSRAHRRGRGRLRRGTGGGARGRHQSAGAESAAVADKKNPLEFKRIKTVADLEREVAAASAAGKSVMLDFYADWCVSCKEMEHNTFTVPEVQAALRTWCCCRPMSPRTMTKTRRCSSTSASSARRPSPSMALTVRNGETSASSDSWRLRSSRPWSGKRSLRRPATPSEANRFCGPARCSSRGSSSLPPASAASWPTA